MSARKLTVTSVARGKIDNGRGHLFTVRPGVYDVEEVDDGDLWIIVDAVPECCVIVSYSALGLVECPSCDGRGEYSYRVCEGEWDTDWCENCGAIGGVTPEVAAKLQDEMDEARAGMYLL